MRISNEQAFDLCDVVETGISGRITKHVVAGRFRTRHSGSGVAYELIPRIPDWPVRIGHEWLKRIGYVELDGGVIVFRPASA